MANLAVEQTLGAIVNTVPGSARILESFGLDYCCGGRRLLGDACNEAGLDPNAVLSALCAAEVGREPDWAAMSAIELVDHIESTHHAYLQAELGRLEMLSKKVSSSHGDRHPELLEVRRVCAELREDLEPHMMKEERVLFPMIRELASSSVTSTFHCESVQGPISMMIFEHEGTGVLLGRLRALTNGYDTPRDGCASYQALYEGLAELEADTHLHIHKENNLLFPAVIALEE